MNFKNCLICGSQNFDDAFECINCKCPFGQKPFVVEKPRPRPRSFQPVESPEPASTGNFNLGRLIATLSLLFIAIYLMGTYLFVDSVSKLTMIQQVYWQITPPSNSAINDAIQKQLGNQLTFSTPHTQFGNQTYTFSNFPKERVKSFTITSALITKSFCINADLKQPTTAKRQVLFYTANYDAETEKDGKPSKSSGQIKIPLTKDKINWKCE